MLTQRFDKLTRLRPPGSLLRLLRTLILALICFWATNSEGAGCFSRGTLFVIQNRDIHVMEMTPSGRYNITRQLITGGDSMTAVTVDDVHGFIYWSDNTVNKVRRVRLDGSNQTDVYDGYARGLVVSPELDKLFISLFNDLKIDVTSLNGSGGRTIINCNGYPAGLAVDLNMRLLFYAIYSPGHIYKANLDGTNIRQIVSDVNLVFGLEIDFKTNRIFWADYHGKRIECSNYMGGERRLVRNTACLPWGLAIQDDVAYYTTNQPISVQSLPLTGGSATILDTGTFNESVFWGIAILQRDHCTTGIME